MNYRLITLILFFVLCHSVLAQYKLQLKDADTSKGISYASVFYDGGFEETNKNGLCIVTTEKSNLRLRINHLGYEDFNDFFQFKKGENILYLKSKKNLLKETVVYGTKKLVAKTSVGVKLKSKTIKQNTSVNIGDVLAKTSGVSTIKTGGTIVKPVIHGMYGNRIIVLNNNVVQQGQDWSVEHATEIDPFIADRISVIKGAEGVKYGTGALGGVVLISPPKLPYFTDKIEGTIIGVLSSNGNGITTSAKVGSSAFDNTFAWRIQGTKHLSADVKTAEYFLNNTGTNSFSFSANAGYKLENFGIEGFYSKYQNTYGIAPISEVGNSDDLIARFKIGRPSKTYLPSYGVESPKQKVLHHLLKVNSFYNFNDALKLKFQYSYQQNERQEFFPRRANLSNTPAFHTNLKTQMTSLDLDYSPDNDWASEVGVNYQYQRNKNVSGTKVEPTIPNFTSIGFGGYYIQKYHKKALQLTAGLRYDYKTENIAGIRNSVRFYNNRVFSNTMFSISGNYTINKFSITSNLGLASRFPHVSEMYSYGLKHGGLFFLLGDKNLSIEKAIKWVNGVTYQHPKFSANLSGFVQRFNNYIYEQPSLETKNLWSGSFVVANYKQADALFKGVDVNVSVPLSKKFLYSLQGSLVHATNLDTKGYFPFIPSEKITQELKFENTTQNTVFNRIYFGVAHQFVNKQKRFDSNSDLIQQTPSAYHLFNISTGFTSKKINNKQVSFHISVDNLANTSYKEYTNRYRYFAHDLGRNINLKTIFNF